MERGAAEEDDRRPWLSAGRHRRTAMPRRFSWGRNHRTDRLVDESTRVDRQAPVEMAREEELPLRIRCLRYPAWQHVSERLCGLGRWQGATALADDAHDRAAVADIIMEFFRVVSLPASCRKSLCTRSSASRERRLAATTSRALPNSLVTAERKMRNSSCSMTRGVPGWAAPRRSADMAILFSLCGETRA
jgi:hypothetical protein